MTVYSLHALTGVMGPAKRVTSFSGTRVKEREFRGEKIKTDADDNTLMVLDFGDSLFAFVYGVAAGRVNSGYFGTKGSITAEGRSGWALNGEPLDYPGAEEARQTRMGNQFLLPHVTGPHRAEGTQEHHVFEDVMQLVDLVREGKPTVSTPEHARHVIDIIESAYRSSETGQAQELKTTF
jgi:predicted dehydrogenase